MNSLYTCPGKGLFASLPSSLPTPKVTAQMQGDEIHILQVQLPHFPQEYLSQQLCRQEMCLWEVTALREP